jgi:hypothetical protein
MQRPRIRAAVFACALLGTLATTADARTHRHYHQVGSQDARPRAWCGWWMRQQLGVADRRFNLARSWASYGRPSAGPCVGCLVVWRHHVGRITGHDGRNWIVTSGNDGHAVRTRARSVAGAVFRQPG